MSNNLKKRRVNPEKCKAKKCRCRSEYTHTESITDIVMQKH